MYVLECAMQWMDECIEVDKIRQQSLVKSLQENALERKTSSETSEEECAELLSFFSA